MWTVVAGAVASLRHVNALAFVGAIAIGLFFDLTDLPGSVAGYLLERVSHMSAFVLKVLHWIYGLRPADDSFLGQINLVELFKVVLPALLHGGGIAAVLTAVLGASSAIFAAPFLGVAVAVLTAVVQLIRFFGSGPKPVPAK